MRVRTQPGLSAFTFTSTPAGIACASFTVTALSAALLTEYGAGPSSPSPNEPKSEVTLTTRP